MHLHVSLLAVIFPALLVAILSPENVLAGNKKQCSAGNNKPVLAGNNKPVPPVQTSSNNAKPQAVFISNNKKTNLKPSNKQKKVIESIIARVDSKCLREDAKSCVYTEGDIRLDMQGRVNRDNLQCCNIQIQLNGERKPGKSSTFVAVVVPIDSNLQDVKQALSKSLDDGTLYNLYYR